MGFYNDRSNSSNFVISFGRNPRNDFSVFARGYHNAAKVLSEELLSRHGFSDYEAYPIVFLYRHSFELHLKNVIYKSALLMAFKNIEGVDASLCNNHRLAPLASRVLQILKILFPEDQYIDQFSKRVFQIASEFSDIDSDSYSYRYPIDKRGGYSTKTHQVVNLESVHAALHALLSDFDILDFGINVETEKEKELYELLEKVALEGMA